MERVAVGDSGILYFYHLWKRGGKKFEHELYNSLLDFACCPSLFPGISFNYMAAIDEGRLFSLLYGSI